MIQLSRNFLVDFFQVVTSTVMLIIPISLLCVTAKIRIFIFCDVVNWLYLAGETYEMQLATSRQRVLLLLVLKLL